MDARKQPTFALGVLWWECLTGTTPTVSDAGQLVAKNWAKVKASVGEHAGSTLVAMLHPNPQRRLGLREAQSMLRSSLIGEEVWWKQHGAARSSSGARAAEGV